MPEMDSPQMMATMEMPKEATQQEGYEMADEVMSRIGGLDDVETVGAISGGMSMSSSSSGSTYSFYILLKENGRTRSNAQMAELITGATQDLDCELSVPPPPWICPRWAAAESPWRSKGTTWIP